MMGGLSFARVGVRRTRDARDRDNPALDNRQSNNIPEISQSADLPMERSL
jgi:hypothetical protein